MVFRISDISLQDVLTHSHYDVLTKCSKDTLNINDVNTLHSLRVAKYNKNKLQNLQDFIETEEGSVKF